MLATVNIDHPKLQNYTQEQLEKLIVEAVYSYIDEVDDAENDINFYYVEDSKVPEDVKKLAEELDNMTDDEFEEKYFDFSL